MFYFNYKFCCMCLYREFYLKYSQTMMKHNLHSRNYPLEFPLFHFFIRGYEVGGSLQKPNAEIFYSHILSYSTRMVWTSP